MKIKSTVATLSLLSMLSFGAFAATSIDAQQAQGRQSLGTVTVSSVTSSPMDMNEMLDQKAQEKGASAYRVIEAHSGDEWHATAELYK
ncbi:peroxide/acid stress response protein YhcN [Atlantibacter sp.]|uniref:peroxide/acid stress response protein YhcN n=1 Tax=Atlantibacter sp. TaxID=1903473 RepID=UPI0028A63D95|nr:peroxide/acid stress response protein YhcN [Atlantibacter sp.]